MAEEEGAKREVEVEEREIEEEGRLELFKGRREGEGGEVWEVVGLGGMEVRGDVSVWFSWSDCSALVRDSWDWEEVVMNSTSLPKRSLGPNEISISLSEESSPRSFGEKESVSERLDGGASDSVSLDGSSS